MRDASLKVAWGEEDQVLWIMINRRKESEGLPPGSAFSQQESVTLICGVSIPFPLSEDAQYQFLLTKEDSAVNLMGIVFS
jgi:hypothetical protein